MVTIRLSRSGAKKRPFYHIIVTDSKNRRDGRYIERLGSFNPIANGKEVPLQLDLARVDYWMKQGAQPSERAIHLIRQQRKASSQLSPVTPPPEVAAAEPVTPAE